MRTTGPQCPYCKAPILNSYLEEGDIYDDHDFVISCPECGEELTVKPKIIKVYEIRKAMYERSREVSFQINRDSEDDE